MSEEKTSFELMAEELRVMTVVYCPACGEDILIKHVKGKRPVEPFEFEHCGFHITIRNLEVES